MQKIQEQNKGQMEQLQAAQKFEKEKWAHENELAVLKETERRKTVLQQQAILAMGFDENKDRNNNDVPDVLEVAKAAIDADIKNRKLDLDEMKFQHQQEIDKKKTELEEKKIEAQKQKQQKT